jgi:hypothetical protein
MLRPFDLLRSGAGRCVIERLEDRVFQVAEWNLVHTALNREEMSYASAGLRCFKNRALAKPSNATAAAAINNVGTLPACARPKP